MIVGREDVDSALADWLSLGFSPESLRILKDRLYDRIVCEPSRSSFASMSYEGFDSSRCAHVIKFDDSVHMYKKDKIDSCKYHEIRHCASAEIFHALLDKDSEMYKGLDTNDVDGKILAVYESLDPISITRKKTFLLTPIFSKERRGKINERVELVQEVEKYDGNKLKIISENKASLADALFYFFGVRNHRLRESIAGTEQEVRKNDKKKKISALAFASSVLTGIGLLYFTPSSTAPIAISLLVYLASGYSYTINSAYGDLNARYRLRKNIQNVQEPYDQFLKFITTR